MIANINDESIDKLLLIDIETIIIILLLMMTWPMILF